MKTVLAIDWGQRRIGTAIGNTTARIARPLRQILGSDSSVESIADIVDEEAVDEVVVGLPRNLEGEETLQSEEIRGFAAELEKALQCPVLLQDETLSTHEASSLKRQFPDADTDSLAATVILRDYLNR